MKLIISDFIEDNVTYIESPRCELHLTLHMALVATGDMSNYITPLGRVDKRKISDDIISGKLEIVGQKNIK